MTDAQTEAREIAQRLMLPDEDVFELAVDIIAAALAAKDAELAETRQERMDVIVDRNELRAQLAEARKALGEIEQEARSLPLHTSAVTWEHVLTSKLAVVRDAARRALETQEIGR